MHNNHSPVFLVVDLFCGAGGVTTGFAMAKNGIAKVIACVNHDPKAIESHWKNHPEVKHFEEDIRTLDLTELTEVVKFQRSLYPDALLILWASLECTNFSKAKGGQPRDADSRTLADHLHRYVESIHPDYVMIENVVEFMSWGPLDENGKPISRRNGEDFLRWCSDMCAHGYVNEWNELNSADFGAYTSRKRLFGVFSRPSLPVVWPQPTHSKKPGGTLFEGLQKWKAVKEVLDFKDEGESIFSRKKPLSDKTLERIYAGLVKYVAKGDTAFISKYFSGAPKDKNKAVTEPLGAITTVDHHSVVQPVSLLKYNSTDKKGVHYPPSINEPAPVVTTQQRLGIIQAEFIVQRNSGEPESKIVDVDGPARTLTGTGGNQDLVQAQFLDVIYGNGYPSSIDNPAPTLRTKDGVALVQPFILNYNHSSKTNDVEEPSPAIVAADKLAITQPEFFIDKHFSKSQNQSINEPAGTVMPTDKHRLVEAVPFIVDSNYFNKAQSIENPAGVITASKKWHYLVNPSHGGHSTSTEAPCPVIVARQDKAPLYLVQVENGPVAVCIYDTDSEPAIRIKQFMAAFGLVDIKMRMLRVHELLKIQGFPNDYVLCGNQSDQKKFIGNSVVPLVVKVWIEAMSQRINE